MRKFIVSLILILLFTPYFFFAQNTNIANPNKSEDEREKLLKELEYDDLTPAKYQINAKVFPDKREIICEEILKFTNSSKAEINKIMLNLFYNAFENKHTTFFKESGIFKLSKESVAKLKFGNIEITEINIISRSEKFSKKIKYISPDDNNSNDKTVAEIKLDKPILPGNSIWLKIKYKLNLPQIFFKTGQANNYLFLSHWYPKIGLLRSDGSWDIHQFHRKDRFVENFADFNVRITIPSKFKIGSTGTVIKKEEDGKGRTIYEISALNVHDFAWVAFPYFREIHKKIKLKGNNFETDIIILLSPGHRSAEKRYIGATVFALKYMSKNVGAYPYKTLTIVDPPLKGFNSAGYKYPGIITAAYLKLIPYALKITEMSIFRGISGQYWYGIVTGKDLNSIRIEDGVATFFEMEIMDSYFLNRASFFNSFFLNVFDWELKRLIYLKLNPSSRPEGVAMGFLMNKYYFSNLNFNISLLLRSLKNYLGKDKIFGFFGYYFNRFKFTPTSSKEFSRSFNNYFGEDYSWAFDQFAKQYPLLDTAVHSVSSDQVAMRKNIFRNEAVFVRKSGYFPVDLLIRLKSGKELKIFWKEREKWKKVTFDDTSPIDFAAVDPGFKIPLDINLVNNSKSLEKKMSVFNRLALKFGFLFQNILGFLPL